MSVTILPFIEGQPFNPDVVRIMGEAYDMACDALHDSGQPTIVREVIAKHVIDIAKTGEFDAQEICNRVLLVFGVTR